jgi:hypothetical protein
MAMGLLLSYGVTLSYLEACIILTLSQQQQKLKKNTWRLLEVEKINT